MIERDYGIRWYVLNGIRAEGLDHKTLTLMKQSGCMGIYLAVESGSQRVFDDIIRKKSDLEHLLVVVKIVADLGLKVGCFFVIGFPGEKTADMRATWKFMKKLYKAGMSIHWVGYATPYPRTRLLEICYEKECLIDGFDPFTATPAKPSIVTNDWSLHKLEWYYALLWERSLSRSLMRYMFNKLPQGLQTWVMTIKAKGHP